MERLKLNIQLFADETGANVEGSTPVAGDNATPVQETKPVTFDDMLGSNKEYQKEFDRRVNKGLETAKAKWEAEYKAQLEAQKTEAEKLAKMDADQKMQYELEKAKKERDDIKNQLNAINLYKTASEIASQKELPIGYLDLIDFSKENAETITSKIDKLLELRQKDMQSYLNNKLKQPTPQEKGNSKKIDPYIEGFLSEF